MTAVPDHESGAVHLICDRCGELLAATAARLHDPELVWPLLVENGWTGSPFLTGTHQCPACRAAPPEEEGPTLPGQRAAAGPWRAGVAQVRGAVVVTPQADITADVTEEFRRCLAEALGVDRHIVLNMARSRTLSPPGLAVLVRAHCEVKRRGGALCLVAPSRFVVTALHTMRLDTVFPRFEDCWGALAWLDAGKPEPAPGTTVPVPGAPVPGVPVRPERTSGVGLVSGSAGPAPADDLLVTDR